MRDKADVKANPRIHFLNKIAIMKKKDYSTVQFEELDNLKEFIGEGGTIAFEHGFRKPQFTNEGYKYVCHMVTDKVAYCRKKYADGTYRSANLLLGGLSAATLKKLHKAAENYLEYCQKEA